MKYIIDIEEKPLCVFDEDTQTYFPRLWRVKGFNSLVFDEEGLSRLEELNADYINENYGQLQDDAYERGRRVGYQKGFEDGKKEAESSEAIEQVKMDAFNKGMLFKEEKIHDAFLRGFEKGKAVNDKGCDGCRYECENKRRVPCIFCSNNIKLPSTISSSKLKSQWQAKNDKIDVEDKVRKIIIHVDTDELI